MNDVFLFLLVIFYHHVNNTKDKTRKIHADKEKKKNKLAQVKIVFFYVSQKIINLLALSGTKASNIQVLNHKQKKLVIPSMIFLLLMIIIKT